MSETTAGQERRSSLAILAILVFGALFLGGLFFAWSLVPRPPWAEEEKPSSTSSEEATSSPDPEPEPEPETE